MQQPEHELRADSTERLREQRMAKGDAMSHVIESLSITSGKSPVDFVGEPGPGAMIDLNMPQPGQLVGRRILKVEDIADDWFQDSAKESGTPWAEHFGLEKVDGIWRVRDPEILTSRWLGRYARVSALSLTSRRKLEAQFNVSARTSLASTGSLVTWARNPIGGRRSNASSQARQSSAPDQNGNSDPLPLDIPDTGQGKPPKDDEDDATNGFSASLSQIDYGVLQVPVGGVFGGTNSTDVDLDEPPKPMLFIVQSIGISSFLGDYGLGRTVKTFTLLPGETTTIHTRTWRATEESISLASSIIDSYDESARDRFEETVTNETTDKATQEKSENWHVEADAKGSFGIASASVSGGGGGEYSSGTEEFSRALDNAVSEHTSEASSHRENTVTSSSESSVSTEDEEVIERTIKNINVRRVLNFTFRELNQKYTVKTHLQDIHIAFSNGNAGSWREVPLSGLRGLIEEVIKPEHVEKVCSDILGIIAIVRDVKDSPVRVLEQVLLDKCGTDFQTREAEPGDNCIYAPPTRNGRLYYRFKRGPLAQSSDEEFPVNGVVLSEREIVMATDSVVVEALLGQVDALDNYSQDLQIEAIREKRLANDKVEAALRIIQSGDATQAGLYQQVFGVCCPNDENEEATS